MVIVFLWFLAMKNVAIAGLSVTYIRFTGEHAPATIVGPSTRLERVSILYPLMGSKDMRTMLNFAYTLCSSAMFLSDVLGVGYGQVFCVQCLFVLLVACKHGLV